MVTPNPHFISSSITQFSGDFYKGTKHLPDYGLLPHLRFSAVVKADYGGVKATTQTYSTFSTMLFKGTDILGPVTSIQAVVFVAQTTKPGDLRVYDFTNNQVIAEYLGFNSLTPAVITLNGLANVSTDAAVWEIQMRRQGNKNVCLCSLDVNFHEDAALG